MEDEERKMIIGNIYRPPRNNVENYKVFDNDLDQRLTSFSNTKDVVLVGDYNIDPLQFYEILLLKMSSTLLFQIASFLRLLGQQEPLIQVLPLYIFVSSKLIIFSLKLKQVKYLINTHILLN